jgi:hypothetical protein
MAAEALFEEMLSKKLRPTLLACNFILTKFAEHGGAEAAVKFLEAMQVISTTFNRNTCNFLSVFHVLLT